MNALGNPFSETVTVDTVPPTLTLDPGNRQTLDQSYPLMIVQYSDAVAGVDISTLMIQIDGVTVTTNFNIFGSLAIGNGSNLTAGSHTWNASIANLAGTVASTSVTFTATGSVNSNAPTMSGLDLGSGVTVLPDMGAVWVQGTLSDPTASVSASVNGGTPFLMNQRGAVFGYNVPLAWGTNVIALVAADASGTNQSSQVLVVERSNQYQAAITSPDFGSFANGQAQWVSGYVSSNKNAGLPCEEPLGGVTVNGIATTLTTNGDGTVSFTTVTAVPVPQDGTPLPLQVQIVWPSTNNAPLWYVEGYQIVSKSVEYQNPSDPDYAVFEKLSAAFSGDACSGAWNIVTCQREDYQETYTQPTSSTNANDTILDSYYAPNTNCSPDATMASIGSWYGIGGTTNALSTDIPAVGLSMGTLNDYQEQDLDLPGTPTDGTPNIITRGIGWQTNTATMTVNWPMHYPTGQVVLLTFENVNYTCLSGDVFMASNVLYNGQSPVATNGQNLSYWVTCPGGGQSFTLDDSKFTWPTSSENFVNYPWEPAGTWEGIGQQMEFTTGSAHLLSFTAFHNDALTVNVVGPDKVYTTTDADSLPITLQADVNPPGGTYEWFSSSPNLMLEADLTKATLTLHGIKGHSSDPGDSETLYLTYTVDGKQKQKTFNLSVLKPKSVTSVNVDCDPQYSADACKKLKYQILDQNGNAIAEVVNINGVNVRIAQLKVSEKRVWACNSKTIANSASYEPDILDWPVNDDGTFSDELAADPTFRIAWKQTIWVHQLNHTNLNPWEGGTLPAIFLKGNGICFDSHGNVTITSPNNLCTFCVP